MKQYNLEKLDNLKEDIQRYYDETTTDTNTQAVDLYNTLNTLSKSVNSVTDKVAVMSDMITDLRVLNGTAKNSYSLSLIPIAENNGLTINNDRIELAKTNSKLKEITSKLCSISSNTSYTVRGEDNSSVNIEELIKNDSKTTILFSNSNYEASLNLRYSTFEQINTITLSLSLESEAYPYINSIQYIDINNEIQEVIILNNNSRSLDLDENRVLGNNYEISINAIQTNQIIINFSSRTSNKVSFKSIKTYYNSYVTSGNIILGPINSNSPILKLAIDSSSISTGCTLEISVDKQSWTTTTNSSSMIVNDAKKIVSFNTINELSFKGEDVYNIYIRITLKASELNEDIVPVFMTLRENNSVSPDVLGSISNDQISAYRYKNSDFKYGSYSYTNYVDFNSINLSKIETVSVNGITKCLGLIDSDYSISNKTKNASNIGIELKHLRLPSKEILDATTYDVSNAKLLDIYLREIKATINSTSKNNMCFTLKVKEDIYKIVTESKLSIDIDLTTPFVKNSSATLIAVPYEDLYIKNSIGELVRKVSKESLVVYSNLYFLNLVNILFEPIKVKGFQYSTLYPIAELSEGEYGLLDGKILTSGEKILEVEGYELLESVIKHSKIVSYENGNYIKRLDDNFNYYHQQIEQSDVLKTVIKLDKVSIQKGTLELYEYTDGLNETYISDTSSNKKYLNVGTNESPIYILTDEDDLNTYLQE